MKTDQRTGVLAPFDFSGIHEEFPSLREQDIDIEVVPFEPIDSSNASPALWIKLAEIIRASYDRFDGFVVLHGTDTMSYSSSALSFMLENLTKPVVFTGSQIPIGVMRTDGRENLITAIEIAAAKDKGGRAMIPEVCLYFQNKLFRANRTMKLSAEDLSAFASYNYPALADVGIGLHYNRGAIMKPRGKKPFGINTALADSVMIIKIFPGLTERVFRSMLSTPGVKSIILETYGSGNAPTYDWFIDAVAQTVKRGVHVMNVTQCASGSVDMDIYETGRMLRETGVVSGRDITTEAAAAKMMHLLGRGLPRSRFIKELGRPLRGEMSE
jgi:L-asparaginase